MSILGTNRFRLPYSGHFCDSNFISSEEHDQASRLHSKGRFPITINSACFPLCFAEPSRRSALAFRSGSTSIHQYQRASDIVNYPAVSFPGATVCLI